jgi:hypothetical protein
MLAIFAVVIAALSLAVAGQMKLAAMVVILLQLFTIPLITLVDQEESYLPESTIPMLKRFGLGGQRYTLN